LKVPKSFNALDVPALGLIEPPLLFPIHRLALGLQCLKLTYFDLQMRDQDTFNQKVGQRIVAAGHKLKAKLRKAPSN